MGFCLNPIWYFLDQKRAKEYENIICDPPYDFRDKGDKKNKRNLKSKEFNTLTRKARAHFNEAMLCLMVKLEMVFGVYHII